MKPLHGCFTIAASLAFAASILPTEARAHDVVLNAQGEFLDAYVIDGTEPPVRRVFIDPDPPDPSDLASHARVGRHVNGKLCFFPANAPPAFRGKFVIADDTYRESCVNTSSVQARCSVTNPTDSNFVGTDPDGWGVFNRDGTWTKQHIHASWTFAGDPAALGTIDPQGCAFDGDANLIGNDVGVGELGVAGGAIVMFFASTNYTEYCFLAKGLSSPGMPAFRDGAIYVPQSGGGVITKLTAPFPTGPGDCEPDGDGHPVPKSAFQPQQEAVVPLGSLTPAGIASNEPAVGLGPLSVKTWYVSSVLLPPMITEYVEVGAPFAVPVRSVVLPFLAANPIGLDVGSDGTVYYAELSLSVPDFGTGCGRVSRAANLAGVYLPPEVLGENLQFPDGVTVVDAANFTIDMASLPPAAPGDPAACQPE